MTNNTETKDTTITQNDEALDQDIQDLEAKKEVKGGFPRPDDDI